MEPESARRRPEVAPRAVPKKCRKMTPKPEPKGSQKGHPKSLKIMKKGYPKTRSITGGPLGRPRVDIGATLGLMLMISLCILVFPHVCCNAFRVEIDVFPCVYDDSTLRFSCFFVERASLLIFV